jgi:hypothetical protein
MIKKSLQIDPCPIMKIRCADPSSFTAEVTLKRGSTIADLKHQLQVEFNFNSASCSVLTGAKEWKDDETIRLKKNDSRLFVFLDRERYYDKSFPAVEGAFHFPHSRFGKPPVQRIADDPPIDPADFPDLPHERPFRRRTRPDPPPDEPTQEAAFEYEIEGATIRLLAAEEAAVRRLLEIGFDFQTAVQVYVACDRDENAARGCLIGMR